MYWIIESLIPSIGRMSSIIGIAIYHISRSHIAIRTENFAIINNTAATVAVIEIRNLRASLKNMFFRL